MEKQIKDYLHLYLGCECINYDSVKDKEYKTKVEWTDIGYPKTVKYLILRKLDSMTEEERAELKSLVGAGEDPLWVKNIAIIVKWYLDHGFDIYQLIDLGLAIESPPLQPSNR